MKNNKIQKFKFIGKYNRMIYDTLCGFNKEAIFVILKDSLKRISSLQHLSPQYFCNAGALINGVLYSELVSQRTTSKIPKFNDENDMCTRPSSSSVEGATYGPCGRFERRMCQILDSVELARAEITGIQAIRLPDGRIQYINDQQIRERKINEDLQIVSGCLNQILKELEDNGTFKMLRNYITEKLELTAKIELSATSDKASKAEIQFLEQDIENFHEENKKDVETLLTLTQHLKHQKQELKQKNLMEYNFTKAKTNSDIEQLKLRLKSLEDEVTEDMSYVKCQIDRESKANMELSMHLRNSIQTMEQSIDYWIGVHTTETSKIQTKIKNLTKDFETLNNELETLAIKYVNYEKVCIEDRLMKAEQAKLDEIEALLNSKALMIQKWWRFICVMLSIGPHDPKRKTKKGKNKKK